MRIHLDRCSLAVAPAGEDRFEAVRERRAQVRGGARHGHEALRHAVIECRTHELVDGRECQQCAHFLNDVPAADGQSVLVRCVVFETDTIECLMTRAEDLVTIDASEPTAVAAARMMDHAVRQLVVTAGDEVVGLIAASAVTGGEGIVRDFLGETFPVVPRTLPLGATARAFREGDLQVAGVLDGEELVGLVTRDDLRRAGVPEL
jgi:hypothetical protein